MKDNDRVYWDQSCVLCEEGIFVCGGRGLGHTEIGNDERRGDGDWLGYYWSARCNGRVTSTVGGDWMHVKSEDNDSTLFRDCN
jgi:hypothetical protein